MLFLVTSALAVPVTYTGFTITDGQLGSWSFTNARVYLTFQTDTSNVQQTQIAGVNLAYVGSYPPAQLCTGTPTAAGTARVTIIKAGHSVTATFAPNQIFVSIDQVNGGVGFGSCGPSGFQPAYPLGIAGGTIFGRIFPQLVGASPELAALPIDLTENAAYSGRAYICVGFPTFGAPCSPPNPLQTDKGTLTLQQPYQQVTGNPPSYGDPLGGGIFIAVVGAQHMGGRNTWEFPVSWEAPITYNALAIADVSLGGETFPGALVYLSWDTDHRTVVPFHKGNSYGYANFAGKASVTIVAGHRVISARILPKQLYVFFDVGKSNAGFGSFASGPGYPLSITATQPQNSIYGFENSTLGAVADILRTPADAANYTPATGKLLTDLTNSTTLSGNVSSCASLDPATAICSNLTPAPLSTSHGPLTISEPYTGDASGTGSQPYSVNVGLFWTDRRPTRH